MKTLFVDTNIFLRYLTGDDTEKFERCKNLFKKALKRKIRLMTSHMVVAELIWTLQSFYKVPKSEVIDKIFLIVNTPEINIPDRDIISEALLLYSRKNIDYIDAYNAVFMKYHKVSDIYSYDSDFDSIDWLNRIEP